MIQKGACVEMVIFVSSFARADIIDHPWDKSGLEQRMI